MLIAGRMQIAAHGADERLEDREIAHDATRHETVRQRARSASKKRTQGSERAGSLARSIRLRRSDKVSIAESDCAEHAASTAARVGDGAGGLEYNRSIL